MISARQRLTVGVSELRVSNNVTTVLVVYGLGAGVAIGLYDPGAHLGGLLHALRPQRTNTAAGPLARYVDSGLDALLTAMTARGARLARLRVWLAGGANVLGGLATRPPLNIGERNIAAARVALTAQGLIVRAQAAGGQVGRTLRLYLGEGRMTTQSLNCPEKELG